MRSSLTPRAFMAAVIVSVLWAMPLDARAQRDMDVIRKLSANAMQSFDMLDYENAKKLLVAAVAKAKTSGLESDPAMARVYLNLGIVYFAGLNDADSARVAFLDAVRVDPGIEIDPAYKTAEMQALLDEVKDKVEPKPSPGGATRDCSAVKGIQHTLIDTARASEEVRVEALLGSDVQAARMALHYRMHPAEGVADADFSEIKMKSEDGCAFVAAIPGSLVALGVIHYYVAAYDDQGRVLASKGSSRTPNLIEVTASGDSALDENPLRAAEESDRNTARILVSVAMGSGGAYVTGETEQTLAPINCCFAPALLHVLPEIGYYIEPGTSLSLAMRLGFPVGANLPNHATAAPAGLVRLRKTLSDSARGLFWSATVGGGVIRQSVALAGGVDVDTSAIGPLLVGGGFGYLHGVSRATRLVAELGVTLGLPVVSELGTARLNFGAQVDINLGVMFAL